MERDLAALAERFIRAADEFPGCPLYRELCLTVAADERLLKIAAERRSGQQAPYLLLAAVHFLLLQDPAEELARWYVSIDGPRARPPETSSAAFTEFCLRRRQELVALVREKLVQTNVVKRAAALRLGLAHVRRRTDKPVTLIEIGASAGVLLGFDRYRYRLGGRTWGRPDSPVEIDTEWRGPVSALPDLDHLPPIERRLGIDLSPIDPRDPVGRRWLRALIWPGNEAQWELLQWALDLLVDDPPRVLTGDAIGVLDAVTSSELAPDEPLVVFHAATLAHVPGDRREAFDAAIRGLGADRRVFRLSLEGSRESLPELRGQPTPAHLLQLSELFEGMEERQRLAIVQPHGEWITPLVPSRAAGEAEYSSEPGM